MKAKLFITSACILIFAAPWLYGQATVGTSNNGIVFVTVDPAGSCPNGTPLQYNYSNGALWGCDSGTWTAVTGGGAPSGPAGGNLGGTYPNPSVTGIRSGLTANKPGTCTTGDLYFATDATAGQQIYECNTNVWTQQLDVTSSAGGVISYSGPALSTVSGTIYCPPGGGGACSATETNVDLASSSQATITNLSVQLSAAVGAGNSVAVTWRKAGVDQSSTCTISGASQTECQDTTHSFNVSQGDLLAYKLVFTGTIIVNPFLGVMSQFGTSQSGGTVNSGTSGQLAYYAGPGTAVSGGGSAQVIANWTGTCNSTSTLGADGICKVTNSGFNVITSGTNTAAAMLVGAGASLAPTSTGTVSANQLSGIALNQLYSGKHGSLLGVGYNNSSASALMLYPFTDTFTSASACTTQAASFWQNPTSGWVRNITGNISGTNTNSNIRFQVLPGCGISNLNIGALYIPSTSAAGGYKSTWSTTQSNAYYVEQYSPLAFTFARVGGTAVPAIISSAGVEFISDDGTTDSIMGFGQATALTASSTQFEGFGSFINATEANITIPIPIAGTFKNLMGSHITTPTNNVVVTFNKNLATTALTFTIAGGDTAGTYQDTTHTVSVVAGDNVDLQTVTGATTQATLEAVSVLFVPTDGVSAIVWGMWNASTVTTTTKWSQPFSPITSTTEANTEYTLPFACTAQNLYVYQASANGGSTVTTFTLYKNNATTAITGTIGVGTTGSVAVDTTHSVAFAAGDRINLAAITNTGTSGTIGGWGLQCL